MARILVTEKIAEGGLKKLRDAGHVVDTRVGLGAVQQGREPAQVAHTQAPRTQDGRRLLRPRLQEGLHPAHELGRIASP